jgi:hypothetical protein
MTDKLDVKGIAARQRALLDGDFLNQLGSKSGGDAMMKTQLERIGDEFGKYLVKKVPGVLEGLNLVSSKDLAQSGQYDLVLKGNEVISLKFYLADHWVNVHYGEKRTRAQGANPPPLEAISKWIAYKGIPIREANDQPTSDVINANLAAAKRIQMAIWNRGYTVKRFGKKGSRFMDQVLDQNSLNALAELMAELGARVVAFDILSVVPINPRNGSGPRT